jgi:hypothetical protein
VEEKGPATVNSTSWDIEADNIDVDPDKMLMLSRYLKKLKLLPGAVSHPISGGKPDASHMCARI